MTQDIFRTIVDVSPYPVYLCTGPEMIVSVANQATLKAWGKDSGVIGKPFLEALPEMKGQPFIDLLKQVYTTGKPYYTDNDRADLEIDGKLQTFFYKFSYQPIYDEFGKIYGVACFASDITELQRARFAIDESRTALTNLVMQAPLGICIIRASDLVVEIVNTQYLELVGKMRHEIENRKIWEAVPEAEAVYASIMNEVITTGNTYMEKEAELILIRKGIPERVFVDFVYEPIHNFEGITSLMVIGIDVTEKVLARKSIEEAEARTRLAVEAAEIGIFDVNLLTDEMIVSERFYNIFGFEKLAHRDVFRDMIHPDDRADRIAAYEIAYQTGKLNYEARINHLDGTIHWIRVQGHVYFDQGKPNRLLGTMLDITEVKLLQQQKDDFISVASHELKTPMTSVKASIQVLDKLIKSDAAAERIITFIEKASSSLKKMQHLVDSLLDVSKISAGQLFLNKTKFKISTLINDCCNYIRESGDYELSLTGDKDLEVFADQERIEQVMVNLINNAVKYAPDSKRIILNIEKEGDMGKISVIDFGPGIPSEKLPHLFERYYRVDAAGRQYSGLGLGLYISAEIVQRHGGKIGVESKENESTTFWFILPVD